MKQYSIGKKSKICSIMLMSTKELTTEGKCDDNSNTLSTKKIKALMPKQTMTSIGMSLK